MTDDLAKYANMAGRVAVYYPDVGEAILELVAMVRKLRNSHLDTVNALETTVDRAEAAERELAELKRCL